MEARELMAEVVQRPAAAQRLKQFAEEAAESGLSLAEQNRRVTEAAWLLSRRRGPALILGFGSLPYPAVHLSDQPGARRLRRPAGRQRRQRPNNPASRCACCPSSLAFLT